MIFRTEILQTTERLSIVSNNFKEGEKVAQKAIILKRDRRNSRFFSIKVSLKIMWKDRMFYLLLLPGITYFLLFHYQPMYGATIAFRDFSPMKGILGSEWVGFKNFLEFFTHPSFYTVTSNTVIISFYKLLFGFPAPIILALLLNEVKNTSFKRSIQTITYLPHFMSWVVIAGLISFILSPTTGIVNHIIQLFGFDTIYFMASPKYFRGILVLTDIWKEMGWGSIVYLAALSGISSELYESAMVDGAGRWKQTIYITIPELSSTIVVMLILRMGTIMNAGFDQVYTMYNPAVYSVSDILDTFVYRMGLESAEYSFATAVGLFKSFISFVLVLFTNFVAKKLDSDQGLW